VRPIRVVKSLYRGTLLGRISASVRIGRLVLPPAVAPTQWRSLLRILYRRNLEVHLGSRYPHGVGVVRYLARYVKGGPLQEHRLQRGSDERICFDYVATVTFAAGPEHFDGCALRPASSSVDESAAQSMSWPPTRNGYGPAKSPM
jgi:hypothetical protein